jgi:thiol-disulfide isomerase/thioredoxin
METKRRFATSDEMRTKLATIMSFVLAALAVAGIEATAQTRSFSRVVLLEEKGETSAAVSVGDLNGDGLIDIVLAKGRHWPLHDRVLLNDGKGGFIASNLSDEPDRTYSAALADLDLDGDLDIVVSNDTPDPKKLFKNNGKGHFTLAGSFGEPAWTTRYVTLADLDGDRYPDIAVANRVDDPKSPVPSFVCRNNQKGEFSTCDPISTGSATSIVAADLDGDGALDLFIPHRDGGQSIVLWNDGKGGFHSSTKVGPSAVWIRMAAAGDFDGDGRLDLAVIEERKKAAFLIRNLGQRRFGQLTRLPGVPREPYAIAVSDLNRDGKLDIVVGHVELPGSVYFNLGRGRFREIAWNYGKGVVYGMAFADLNGDGWPDIVAARSDAPNGIWFSSEVATKKQKSESENQNAELKDLNGRIVRLSDYKGKVVLINFWATWCPPCRAEMPDLVRLQREHAKDGLQIIGITYPPEQKARVRRFASRLKVNYPIVLGTRELKSRFSSDETLPLTVVINRDGKVSDIIGGILLREEFDEKIKPLLMKNGEGGSTSAKSNH